MTVTTRLKQIENRLYIEPKEKVTIFMIKALSAKEIGLPDGTPHAEVEKAFRVKYPNYFKITDREDNWEILEAYKKMNNIATPEDPDNEVSFHFIPGCEDLIWDKVAEFMDKEWKC